METDTPETDQKASPHIGFYSCATVPAEFARKLERERDEALEKIKQQKLEIVRLNGATNHAGGTPLKIALRERDEWRKKFELSVDAVEIAARLARAESERDDLQKAVNGLCDHLGVSPVNTTLLAVEILRIIRERDEANHELNKKYIEYDKLFDVAELIKIERDQMLEALMKIEEIFIDGADTYNDWLAMGSIARTTLEKLNKQ